MAREKIAAFKKIAADLGAKELKIRAVQVRSKKGWFGGTVPVPEVAGELGLELSYKEDGEVEEQTFARFGRPKTKARLAPEHSKWANQFPNLSAMVYCRIEQSLEYDRVHLEVKDTWSVNGKLLASIAGQGVNIGGGYESVSHSIWHYEIEYWPEA